MNKEYSYKGFAIGVLGIILTLIIAKCNAQIPKDKQDHFVAGSLIGFSTSALTVNAKPLPSLGIAVGSSVLVGGAKELVYDKWMGKGTPEVKDFAFTVAGGVAGWGVIQGFKWMCKKIERRKTRMIHGLVH